MSLVQPREFERMLKSGDIAARIIVFTGDNLDLKSDLFKSLRRNLGIPAEDPFRLVVLDSDMIDADPGRVADELGAISMFGGARLIRAMVPARQCQNVVEQALAVPRGDTAIAVDTGDLTGVSWIETLRGEAEALFVACGPEGEGDFHAFVASIFMRHGLSFDDGVVEALVLLIGEDRAAVRGEVEKLDLLAGDTRRITIEMVREVVADASSMLADEIGLAALAGDSLLLSQALERLRLAGADAVQALGAAGRQALSLHRGRVRQWTSRKSDPKLSAADLRALSRVLSNIVQQTRSDSANAQLIAERALVTLAKAARKKS